MNLNMTPSWFDEAMDWLHPCGLADLLRGLLLILGILLAGLFLYCGSGCGENRLEVLLFVDNGKILGPSLSWE